MPAKRPSNRPTGRRGARAPTYDQLESHREALHRRLGHLGEAARLHPSYETAKKLLNERFRASTLRQRATVLESASWLIGVLEALIQIG